MSVHFISDDKQLEVSPYYKGALVEIGDREIDIDEEEIERLIVVLQAIINPANEGDTMSKCKCSWSISILGDGCRYCQPQEYIDHLEESLKELEENDDKLERVLMFVGMAAKYLEAAEYTKVKNKLRHIAQAIV